MRNQHTPRPWTVHHRMRDCVTFEGRDGTENLFLQNVDGYYACQNEEDAMLIAAAPDLLEVAREALAVIRVIKPPQNGNGTIVRLEDAIAKATGEKA